MTYKNLLGLLEICRKKPCKSDSRHLNPRFDISCNRSYAQLLILGTTMYLYGMKSGSGGEVDGVGGIDGGSVGFVGGCDDSSDCGGSG